MKGFFAPFLDQFNMFIFQINFLMFFHKSTKKH